MRAAKSLARPAIGGILVFDRQRAVETSPAGLAQKPRPIDEAEPRQLVLPPALAVITDSLQALRIDCRVLGMKDGDAILHRLHRLIGIDTDADEVRRIEFQAETGVLDPLKKLLPSFWRRTDEIVLWTRPVLNCEGQAIGLSLRYQPVGEIGEVIIIGFVACGVVPAREDHEDRDARFTDRAGKFGGRFPKCLSFCPVGIELIAEIGDRRHEEAVATRERDGGLHRSGVLI